MSEWTTMRETIERQVLRLDRSRLAEDRAILDQLWQVYDRLGEGATERPEERPEETSRTVQTTDTAFLHRKATESVMEGFRTLPNGIVSWRCKLCRADVEMWKIGGVVPSVGEAREALLWHLQKRCPKVER